MEHLLEIQHLKVEFPSKAGNVHAVNDANLYVDKGETLGIVGESGCGKSVTLSCILNLVETPPAIIDGQILFHGENILGKNEKEFNHIRGNRIAMIFQDPMSSLDPVIKVGNQIVEMIVKHKKLRKEVAREEAVRLLRLVGIPDPEERMKSYPHQLSGGMCQRVMIAMALSCEPELLLADEPTTALDVTIQAQILGILNNIREELGTSVVIVTHDLGVVANVATRIAVFYGGRVVEEGDTRSIFKNPLHPYTKGLMECIPTLQTEDEELKVIEGTVPDLSHMPSGCPFHPRCKFAAEACKECVPERIEAEPGHFVSCHRQGKGEQGGEHEEE
ncbi:MAG: ABC transporter ATP-binding protein [Eubacteriales bacterium]|nr:ABC transporter ATP-binding protein [Eubacteriales bacterium]